MRTHLAIALALSIVGLPVMTGPAFAADVSAPAASQAVQKYVVTVSGMT